MNRMIQSAVLVFILAVCPAFAADPAASTPIPAPKAKQPAKKKPKAAPAPAQETAVEKAVIEPPAVTASEEKATAETPAAGNKPAGKDKFYVELGIPALFNYNTPPTINSINLNTATPNGTWTGGMAIGIGFEKAMSSNISTFLDLGLVTMDVNQMLWFNFGPTKTAATLLNALIGLKVSMLPENKVSPYISGALGVSSMKIDELLSNNFLYMDDVPAYNQARFLTRGGLGMDIHCDEDLTAYFEFQFYDMDSLNIFSPAPDADLVLFKSGLRMAL